MLEKIGDYFKTKWSLRLMTVFYFLAGLNHFLNPHFYLPLIPPYFPCPEKINLFSGTAEIALAVGMMIPRTRKPASFGIILLLLAFIPSHIYFIQIGSCIDEGLCVSEWAGWIRLLIVHPALLFWAWKAGDSSFW